MNLEQIKQHWESAGTEFPADALITPTSRDPYLGQLEEQNVLRWLKREHVVLELGCGDGSHTVKYAGQVQSVSALDLVEAFVNLARRRAASQGIRNIDFTTGSVLELEKHYGNKQYDCVITQRCLINLPGWSHQEEALRQACNLLRRGGLFLITEGFQDELDNLNAVREKFGQPAITCSYNRNFRHGEFEDFTHRHFEVVERKHYGEYLFLSRVFHPLAVLPDQPKHDSRLNRTAMQVAQSVPMPDLERFSYNLFYVLRKR
jgi:ubiquinone/menaquinone biosynthesis C-methylase UbiE